LFLSSYSLLFGKIGALMTDYSTNRKPLPRSMAHPPLRSSRQTDRPASLLGQAIVALVLAFGLLAFLLVMVPVGYGFAYNGRIFPGVSVSGVDLSGQTPEQASALLAEHIAYPTHGQIVFKEGSDIWSATPSELGLYFDSQNTAMAAYQAGRVGGLLERYIDRFKAWYSGLELSPVFTWNEQTALNYLQSIAAKIDKPIIEASIGLQGVQVTVNSGQIGRELDVVSAQELLRSQMQSLQDGIIPLAVEETPPVILDASAQAALAQQILSAPLVLQVENAQEGDPGPWTIEPTVLATMLTIQRVENGDGTAAYQVGLDEQVLRTYLEGIAPNLLRWPVNTRFIFNDETRQLEVIEQATIGRSLDVDTSLQLINQKLVEAVHTITLDMEYTNPQVTDDATAEQLGISEAVEVYTSYFYGSSAERIQNIQLASARFHGLLVPPGATLSMADVLGDVSLDSGYAEAWIIYGDRTIKGVGGGVCQVSTTLFRTAFFGGYQIDERYSHAYRVGYYEQTASGGYDTSMAGLDATVFAPVVDFKFTNDTQYWLLMETYVNPGARTLTWKFYSTSDGREVAWDTSGLANIVPELDPIYEENSELAKGEVRQVDWGVDGADISVIRTVTRNGQVIHQDTFNTHYVPWRDIFQYGPGTKDMPPDPTETPNPY
jgi:vancomycin resistance protein YoaR